MSPRRADPSIRDKLLASARDLFLAQGFAATGIEQICGAAGVSKGALFHNWGGKTELGLEVLDEWTRAAFRAYSGAPFLGAPTAALRVMGYVDFTIELSKQAPIGCLIGTFAQEVSESHPPLRERCAGAFHDWSAGLARMLDEAARETGARRFDGESVARHFIAVFEGAQILAKASQSKAPVEEHLLHFRAYLASLLGLADAAAARRNTPSGRRKEPAAKSPSKKRSPAKRSRGKPTHS